MTGPEQLEPRLTPTAKFDTLPVIPTPVPDVIENVRQIAALGRTLGRNPNAFMKVGDSNTALTGFLTQFGELGYNPVAAGVTAVDPNLVEVVNAYRVPLSSGENSFTRQSAAVHPGWAIPNVLGGLPAEIVATNPAVALVMIGSNDQVLFSADAYRANLSFLVDRLTASGIVPVLSSIPEISSVTGRGPVIRVFNQVIADLAEEKHLPFVDNYRVQDKLPGLGLDPGGVHLTTSPKGGGFVGPADRLYGQNARNIDTLQSLEWVRYWAFGVGSGGPTMPTTTPWQSSAPGEEIVAVGAAYGQEPAVRVVDPATQAVKTTFLAFAPSFTGGVRVAVGDVNGDGVPDIVAAAGVGGGPVVKAFDGRTGATLLSLFAFEPGFRGGVSVAVGDADGDGAPDIVVGAGPGGAARVRVFRASDQSPTADFLTYEPSFRGGVSVAVGDFGGGIGHAVAVGPGVGGGGVVKLFTASGGLLSSDRVTEPAYRGGLSVAAGDLDGDGRAELVTGTSTTAARVSVLESDGTVTSNFFADDSTAGLRVAVVPSRGGNPGLIVAATANPGGRFGLFDERGTQVGSLVDSDLAAVLAGAFVGGG